MRDYRSTRCKCGQTVKDTHDPKECDLCSNADKKSGFTAFEHNPPYCEQCHTFAHPCYSKKE
jgi:hypothetical protein